jgi:hypothetical protein
MMDQQIERFIRQEAKACESADPEMLTVLGPSLVDWFHPKRDRVGAVYIGHDGAQKVTILVCRPLPEYEPTIMQFWEGRTLSEHKAVYFCPNALLIVRPTEEGDEGLIGSKKEVA